MSLCCGVVSLSVLGSHGSPGCFCMWVSGQHDKVFIDNSTVGWPKHSHFMTAWFGKIFWSIYRFAGFPGRFTSCKACTCLYLCTWHFRIVHPYRFVPFASSPCGLQDLADLPRLALLLVSQADGQPSAEKLTEMKPEKRPKTDWAAKLELHFDACFQIPGQRLHSQVCDTIHIYPNVLLSGKGSRPEQIEFNHPGHHLVEWFGYPPSQSVYVIWWFNDELLASNPPLSKCHRLVLVNRAGALVNAFWCSLSSRCGTLSCNGAKSNLGDRWCHGLVNGFWQWRRSRRLTGAALAVKKHFKEW